MRLQRALRESGHRNLALAIDDSEEQVLCVERHAACRGPRPTCAPRRVEQAMADTEVNKRCRAATSVNRDLAVVQDERVRIHVSADVGGAYVLQRDRRHSGLDRFELKNREGSGAGRRKVVAHLVNHLDVAVAQFLGAEIDWKIRQLREIAPRPSGERETGFGVGDRKGEIA